MSMRRPVRVRPSVRPSDIPSWRASERRPKLSFWALCSISLSSRDPLYLGGRDFCRYEPPTYYVRLEWHVDLNVMNGTGQLVERGYVRPRREGDNLKIFTNILCACFLMSKRRSPPLYISPLRSPRATAKSSDITRMFQRRRDPERGEGRRERRRREDIAAATHAHMHKSVRRSVASRPHVVKRSRFLCLSLHKRRGTAGAGGSASRQAGGLRHAIQSFSISPT